MHAGPAQGQARHGRSASSARTPYPAPIHGTTSSSPRPAPYSRARLVNSHRPPRPASPTTITRARRSAAAGYGDTPGGVQSFPCLTRLQQRRQHTLHPCSRPRLSSQLGAVGPHARRLALQIAPWRRAAPALGCVLEERRRTRIARRRKASSRCVVLGFPLRTLAASLHSGTLSLQTKAPGLQSIAATSSLCIYIILCKPPSHQQDFRASAAPVPPAHYNSRSGSLGALCALTKLC